MDKQKLMAHLITLPRWFALPAVVTSVLLGCILGGELNYLSVIVCFTALFLMAGAHSWNSYLDKEWTHFDEGAVEERSKEKTYTIGQSVIAKGILAPRMVAVNATIWYIISAVLTAVIAIKVSPIIWAIWVPAALCTVFYSWGKLHNMAETALGLGFGPFAVMLGMATQSNPNFLTAFLAGLPLFFVWGWTAEFVDQAIDAEHNWPRGLRNLGAYAWKNNISVPLLTLILLMFGYMIQAGLVIGGILAPMTFLTFIAFPIACYAVVILGDDFNKKGLIIGLFAALVYTIALPVGQLI